MSDDLPYKAEYSKSGRAACKACKGNISKDSLRVAKMVQVCSISYLISLVDLSRMVACDIFDDSLSFIFLQSSHFDGKVSRVFVRFSR